ncbi:MAG: magnesium/cobalt transporter CorA [Devosia sp.]|nr:magnesium/cobalt transporter CorA [Devosia sp.]
MITAYTSTNELLVPRDFSAEALDGLVWIDLLNPTQDDNRIVGASLGIHVPLQDEVEEIELSSRLYLEDGAEFLTITALTELDTDDPTKMPVTFILKNGVLVTARWCEPKPFAAYKLRAARHKDVPSRNGEEVMIGLLEALIDRLADILEHIGTEIDAISREAFRNKASKANKKTHELQALIERIGRQAEVLTLVQESLVSIGRVTVYHAAMDAAPRRGEVGRESRRTWLKVIQRDVTSLSEHARGLNGRVNFLLDATLGLISLEQNQIIKIFSVAAVVFLPPTLVASIYGMNFSVMPELEWTLGYPFAIGLMVLFAVLPYLFFKRKGWL